MRRAWLLPMRRRAAFDGVARVQALVSRGPCAFRCVSRIDCAENVLDMRYLWHPQAGAQQRAFFTRTGFSRHFCFQSGDPSFNSSVVAGRFVAHSAARLRHVAFLAPFSVTPAALDEPALLHSIDGNGLLRIFLLRERRMIGPGSSVRVRSCGLSRLFIDSVDSGERPPSCCVTQRLASKWILGKCVARSKIRDSDFAGDRRGSVRECMRA